MNKKPARKARWIVGALALLLVIAGFAFREPLSYLLQAVQGQTRLLMQARSIDSLIEDPGTDPLLRARLEKARSIREFATQELGLPDNGNFKRYVDVGSPYVVWNVIATGEFSVEPMQWCYPVAGCLSYRGYYKEEDARAFAGKLREQGYAVQVDAVAAFSTLGWFADPLLSTVIDYSETQLARLIFHELAHSVVWVSDDTRFNEAFAVAVEEEGVRRWLENDADPARQAGHAQYTRRKQDFLSLLERYQHKLAQSFADDASTEEKRRKKAALMQAMQRDYKRLRVSWGGYGGYDEWFRDSVDNAHLASFATYHTLVPGFRELLERSSDISQFYHTVQSLARLPSSQRSAQLLSLGEERLHVKAGGVKPRGTTPASLAAQPVSISG